jgi:hypothetical protein
MYTPDITDNDVFAALRAFLLVILPTSIEVIRSLDNKVAMPKGDFVLMQAVTQERLATNISDYVLDLENGDTKNIQQKINYGIQLDVYGTNAPNNAATISTLFRDAFAYESFPANIKPLYCDNPSQLVFTNAEMQYEKRFMFMVYLQYDPTVIVPAQLATELSAPTIYTVL